MELKYYQFYQYSTISALAAGDFYGSITLGKLLKKGDLGLGTFDGLDGELIILEGVAYQMLSDGQVNLINNEFLSPFATVTTFQSSFNLTLENVSYHEFELRLSEVLPSKNIFYAYKITGEFEEIKTRTVSKQNLPYSTLVDATKNQVNKKFNNIKGTIVGFWSPIFANTITVSGFHSHFINIDKNKGGHVFDFTAKKIVIEISAFSNMELQLPLSKSYLNYDLKDINLQSDIAKAEKQRG